MARYFNKTRGVVTVVLRTEETAVVPPKQVLVVTPEQDRSPSILSRIRKGFLVSLPDTPAPAPMAAASQTQEPIEAPPASEELSEEQPENQPEEKPEEEPEGETPSLKWTKRRLTEYADGKGLELPAGWTKVEILEAIEGTG